MTSPATPTLSTDLGAIRGAGPVLRTMRRFLRHLDRGSLRLTLPDGAVIDHAGTEPGPHGELVLHRWRALRRLIARGDLGFAEGYMAGDWSSPDLPRLIAACAVNLDRLDPLIDGSLPVRIMRRVVHLLRGNSRQGSRRNIAAHYDLGNAFYRPWLDAGMTYSAALAPHAGESLESAQDRKLARIADLLGPLDGRRVLEIGCGWGTLAAHLARRGATVTGLTLSREQLAHGQAMVAAAGLEDRVSLELTDYRDAAGKYDGIVSIEMIEAVGEAWWPTYFKTVHDRLVPGGRAVIQAITIAEDRFEHYRIAPDFIQHYIFPGGMLPTRTIMAEQARAAGLVPVATELFAQGYVATLAEWRRRFAAARDTLTGLGFDAAFQRMWTYYLAYCEAGFATGQTDVGLYVLERPA